MPARAGSRPPARRCAMSAPSSNWLFIRGLGREQGHWGSYFPRVFAELNPGARVHCVDLPGTGTEFARSTPLSIAEIVEDTRRRWLEVHAAAAREARDGTAKAGAGEAGASGMD